MLTLTENASKIVQTVSEQITGSTEAGLRISSQDAGKDFAVQAAESPAPGDEVVESAGAKVFLSEDASQALSDKVLDAQMDANGAVQFALGAQQ